MVRPIQKYTLDNGTVIDPMNDQTPTEKRPECKACQSVGMWHCSDPINCGGMKYPKSSVQTLKDIFVKRKS